MTVFLRALFGPFKPEELKPTGAVIRLDWHFFGIKEDGSMGRWTLCFDVKKRKFHAYGHQMGDAKPLPELVDAFVPDEPMVYGANITAILLQRVTPEEVARCTALAITGGT